MAQLHSILLANHRPYAAVYADATERLAATGFVRGLGGDTVPFTTEDLYKKVLQVDEASEWLLTAITPTWVGTTFELVVACSDLTTALTAVAAQMTFPWPRAVTLTSVHAFLATPQTSGTIFTVDVNEAGVSILSTKITIDNGESDSTTAATAPVLSDTGLAAMAKITVDIDQIGDGTAKGLYLVFLGTRA